MKKVGIITFHRSHNCGSMLESYAIQNVIKKLGFNNEIINFSSNAQKDYYYIFSKKKNARTVIKNIIVSFIYLPHFLTLKRHYNNYEDFINKHLILSSENYNDDYNIDEIEKNYDIFIAGSDQIWNITIPDYNVIYFLPFRNSKKNKIAYAPSFGSKNIMKYADNYEYYIKLLNDFNYLSIRENNGKKWIKSLTGHDVKVVLDPTLLLERKDYEVLEKNANINAKYIFYYAPSFDKNLDKFVKKVSKKYGLKVITWSSKNYYFKFEWKNGFKMVYNQDPGTYLSLIKNAEVVMTTSFHGTIFSTIYKKKFWILKNGGMYDDDDRVKTLIMQLGIQDRLIEPIFNEKTNYLKSVDYEKYNKELPKLKRDSIKYLEGALNNERNR